MLRRYSLFIINCRSILNVMFEKNYLKENNIGTVDNKRHVSIGCAIFYNFHLNLIRKLEKRKGEGKGDLIIIVHLHLITLDESS